MFKVLLVDVVSKISAAYDNKQITESEKDKLINML